MVEPVLFGPLDTYLAPVVEYVVLVLVFANLVTRLLAHRSYVDQADDPESMSRYTLHEVVNGLLLLTSFYYTTVNRHSGIVLSVLVIGMIIADHFEFEARTLEAREGLELERPKGALFASVFVLAYALFISLFFYVEDYWSAIV